MGDADGGPAAVMPPPLGGEEGEQEAGGALGVIREGVGETLIDPEVAKRACEEVLEKVKLSGCVGAAGAQNPEASGLVNGDGSPGDPAASGAYTVKSARRRQKNNSAKQSWLLRLFESKLFDISMAISYVYNSKEPGVQAYIGNRLFSFRHEEVDFYLPQLLNMYIHMDDAVGDAIKPYIVHRCRQSINFSLQCAWLLGAYSSDMHISTQRHS